MFAVKSPKSLSPVVSNLIHIPIIIDVLYSIPHSASIHHLKNLTRLQAVIPFYYPDHEILSDDLGEARWPYDLGDLNDLLHIIEEKEKSLQKLVLLSQHVVHMPIRVYNSLTDLDVCVPLESHILGLDLVFRHAPSLESLSLVGYITRDIFSVLSDNSTTLPHLKSFRLSCESASVFPVTEGEIDVLYNFLQGRTQLRRLYLRFAGAEWNIVRRTLPVLDELVGLEVLGFHTGHDCLGTDDFTELARHIPSILTALYLTFSWDKHDGTSLHSGLLVPLVSGSLYLSLYCNNTLWIAGQIRAAAIPIIPSLIWYLWISASHSR